MAVQIPLALVALFLMSNVAKFTYKIGKGTFDTTKAVTSTAYRVASVPFVLSGKLLNRFVPQNINEVYGKKDPFTLQDLIILNKHFAKHGMADASELVLEKFLRSMANLRGYSGKVMRLDQLDGIDDPKTMVMSRPILELSARRSAKAEEFINIFDKLQAPKPGSMA